MTRSPVPGGDQLKGLWDDLVIRELREGCGAAAESNRQAQREAALIGQDCGSRGRGIQEVHGFHFYKRAVYVKAHIE
jgi:hypothetical protein